MCGYWARAREADQAVETAKARVVYAAAERLREAEYWHAAHKLRIQRCLRKSVAAGLLLSMGTLVPWLPVLVVVPWLAIMTLWWMVETYFPLYGDLSMGGWRGYFRFVFW